MDARKRGVIPAKRTPRPAEGRLWRGASEASVACAKRFYSLAPQKICPTYGPHQKKKYVPFPKVAQLRYTKKKICPFSKCCSIEVQQKKNMSLFQMLLNWGTTKKKYVPHIDQIKKEKCPLSKCCSIEVQQKKIMSLVQILLNWVKTKKKYVPRHCCSFGDFF